MAHSTWVGTFVEFGELTNVSDRQRSLLVRSDDFWRHVRLACTVFVLAYLSIVLTRESGRIAAVWPVNAVVFCALLAGRRTEWGGLAIAGFVGGFSANLLAGDHAALAAEISAINQLEVIVCAWICCRFNPDPLNIRTPRNLAIFAIACVSGATISAFFALGALSIVSTSELVASFVRWFAADSLGLLVLSPLIIEVQKSNTRSIIKEISKPSNFGILIFLFGCLYIIFFQSQFPLLFIAPIPLMVVALRFSAPATAIMIFATVIFATTSTLFGIGPISLVKGDFELKMIVLQSFLATQLICTLVLAAIIEDLRRAADKIVARESDLKAIINSSADVVTKNDLAGSILWISDSCRTLGYEPDDLIGNHVRGLVHPDDLPHAEALRDARAAGVQPDTGSKSLSFRVKTAGGEYVWMEGNPSIIRDGDGKPLSVVNVLRDVSQRRESELKLAESEARFRRLAEGATDIIACFDMGAKITYVSPAVEQILGYRPEELIGQSTRRIMHPDDFQRSFIEYGEKLGSNKPFEPFTFEYRGIHKDGREIRLEARPRPIVSPETGEIIGFQDIARDVTARHALEQEVVEARKLAESAAQVKTDFMANMSHEIRTPLTAILGFTSLMTSREDLSDAARHQASRISAGGQALLAIVNDILDFSKLETGLMPIRPRPASIGETLTESLALFETHAAAKRIELYLDASGDLPHAEFDPDRVRQILLNLISNAVKFTDTGTVTVQANYDADLGLLSVSVCDTGAGMDDDQQARLFQRFSQVDASSTRRHGGTGLGLAISRGLVEAMGGEIRVESRIGEGSTFHVEIPAPRCSAPQVEEQTTDLSVAVGARILVVDDNVNNREVARALLTSIGAEVTEAADGLEAVQMAEVMPYDLILMDIRMPRMDGPDATLKIRGKPGPNQDIPILAFSADYDLERFGEHGTHGFDGHIRKPIDRVDLLSAITTHLSFDLDPGGLSIGQSG